MTRYGRALYYASEELRADKAVVMAAVTRFGIALYFADPSLKADKKVVLAALKQVACALRDASEKLKSDRHIKKTFNLKEKLGSWCFLRSFRESSVHI